MQKIISAQNNTHLKAREHQSHQQIVQTSKIFFLPSDKCLHIYHIVDLEKEKVNLFK